jgi:hypothetical protein
VPLVDLFSEPERFKALLKDSAKLLENQVANKKGLAGMAIKTSFGVVKQMKPGFIEEVLTHLLPKFLEKLEPFYAHFQKEEWENFATFLRSKTEEVANALLSVTDQRAAQTELTSLKKTYEKLRPAAQRHVQDAIPALAELLDKYIKTDHKG